MKTVVNTIKEFSDDYEALFNDYKYVVTQEDFEIKIAYMEKEDDGWVEKESMLLSNDCAKNLFIGMADAILNGDFCEGE